MLRLLRDAGSEVRMIATSKESSTHAHLRERLAVLITTTLALDLVASAAILHLERDESRTGITNYWDALFWTTTQLLTVSSQLANPISAPARVIDIGLQMWAISVVAVLAGSLGTFFHRRGMERDEQDASDRQG